MPEEGVNGAWGGVRLNFAVPGVEGVQGALDPILQTLQATLDIGTTALGVVSTVSSAYLNPSVAAANNLRVLATDLLADLAALGIYVHLGDVRLVRSGSLDGIKGGYNAWERRVVGRLRDTRDPTAPRFSSSTGVIGLFLYVGAPGKAVAAARSAGTTASQVMNGASRIRRLMRQYGRLLGVSSSGPSALPRATGLRVTYPWAPSRDGENPIIAESAFLGRGEAIVEWSSQSPSSDPIPPPAWLLEICTLPGVGVGGLKPLPSSTGASVSYEPTAYLRGESGEPLILMSDNFTLPAVSSWPTTDPVGANANPVFFYSPADPSTVTASPFQTVGGVAYNGKAVLIPQDSVVRQAFRDGTYQYRIRAADLPRSAPVLPDGTVDAARSTAPTQVYVRVTPLSDQVDNARLPNGTGRGANLGELKWDLKPLRSEGAQNVDVKGPNLSLDDVGEPSEIVSVSFPGETGDTFGLAIQTAIAVTILSRSDITSADDDLYAPTGLEAAAQNLLYDFTAPNEFWARRGLDPTTLPGALRRFCTAAADRILAALGTLPEPLAATLRTRFTRLANWKYSDAVPGEEFRKTVLEALQDSPTPIICRNVNSLPGYWRDMGINTPQSLRARLLEEIEGYGDLNAAPRDSIPVLYSRTSNTLKPLRSVFPPAIYEDCRQVLSLAAPAPVPAAAGGWENFRPFQGAGQWARSSRLLSEVDRYLRALTVGLGSVDSAITAAVEALERRAEEIQRLIQRIDDLLEGSFEFDLGGASVLIAVGAGSEDLVSQVLSAENKPTEGPDDYAAGLVFVAGGLPSFLVELIQEAVSGEGA